MSSSVLGFGEAMVVSQAQYVGRDMGTKQVRVIERAGLGAVEAEKRGSLPRLVKKLNSKAE